MLALFLINSILIICAAAAGYILGRLHEQQLAPLEDKLCSCHQPPVPENQHIADPNPLPEGVSIGYTSPPLTNSISTIKVPTAEEVERRNRPQKVKDGEQAMEELLDDVFANQKEGEPENEWGD